MPRRVGGLRQADGCVCAGTEQGESQQEKLEACPGHGGQGGHAEVKVGTQRSRSVQILKPGMGWHKHPAAAPGTMPSGPSVSPHAVTLSPWCPDRLGLPDPLTKRQNQKPPLPKNGACGELQGFWKLGLCSHGPKEAIHGSGGTRGRAHSRG